MPGGVEDEMEVRRIRKGKYIPPRRVVHLGKVFSIFEIITIFHVKT